MLDFVRSRACRYRGCRKSLSPSMRFHRSSHAEEQAEEEYEEQKKKKKKQGGRRKALRVIPRGKHRLMVYRAPPSDSESLSALKSNTEYREIWEIEVTNYLYFSHPSTRKISRLNLQNSLRMIPGLNEGYRFSLV